ncbi:Kae1-associated kinase Bud32 [Candidatus Woesearchaeota archaeon]|nr:MAG: Kae1-associated kinase Bud32 [Candidatus Woesearchaeota archaeon]
MKQIYQGAEAKLYLEGNKVIKDRFKKKYRHPELDKKLTYSRTKREAKVLQKLQELGFPAPRWIFNDKNILEMEHIKGAQLKDVFKLKHCKKIGEMIAEMHNAGIIHGDLTTSNMIMNEKIFFIDFGLSFFSKKLEDKAVDLHLLRQALESKHYEIWQDAFDKVLKGYKAKAKKAKEIIMRLEKVVEMRGRNKAKISH